MPCRRVPAQSECPAGSDLRRYVCDRAKMHDLREPWLVTISTLRASASKAESHGGGEECTSSAAFSPSETGVCFASSLPQPTLKLSYEGCFLDARRVRIACAGDERVGLRRPGPSPALQVRCPRKQHHGFLLGRISRGRCETAVCRRGPAAHTRGRRQHGAHPGGTGQRNGRGGAGGRRIRDRRNLEHHAQRGRAARREGRRHPADGQTTSFPGNPRRGHVARGRCSRADPRRLCAGRRQYVFGFAAPRPSIPAIACWCCAR